MTELPALEMVFDLRALDEIEAGHMRFLARFYERVYGEPADPARIVGLAVRIAASAVHSMHERGTLPDLVSDLRMLHAAPPAPPPADRHCPEFPDASTETERKHA